MSIHTDLVRILDNLFRIIYISWITSFVSFTYLRQLCWYHSEISKNLLDNIYLDMVEPRWSLRESPSQKGDFTPNLLEMKVNYHTNSFRWWPRRRLEQDWVRSVSASRRSWEYEGYCCPRNTGRYWQRQGENWRLMVRLFLWGTLRCILEGQEVTITFGMVNHLNIVFIIN